MVHTFRETAESFVKHGGSPRYLDKVIEYFGDRAITEVHPFDIKQMALELFPEDTHGGATRNRQAVTPARAVVNHGYDRGWCNLIRIKKFKEDPVDKRKREPASLIWMYLFLRQCDANNLPHLAALVLFMNQTGARVSESIRLQWDHVDIPNRRATIAKTKMNRSSVRSLTDDLIQRLMDLDHIPGKPVFRYTSRYSVNERIAIVCKRAGIPNKSPHVVGRHSFATNAIALGMDIKAVMEAGDWKSSSIFLEHYVHAIDAARNVADRLNRYSYKL